MGSTTFGPETTMPDIHDDCELVVEGKNIAPHDAQDGITYDNPKQDFPIKIVWKNLIKFAFLHIAALYGLYLMFTSAAWQTSLFAFFLHILSLIGVTAGAHRLWSHRSYKAKFPLQVFLAFLYTIANQNTIFEWVRDHRVHHKHSETDADPHNSNRGFFFSHIGWLMCRKHPDVIQKGKLLNLNDVMADPIIRFQRKYHYALATMCCYLLPTIVPIYLWGETISNSFYVASVFRYCLTLNQTFLVNSAAHMWGNRPYDVNINPRENKWVSFGVLGEGFHNYHHAFPYDYATSEYGIKYNLTTAFINFMAWIGLAYDLKTVPKSSVESRKLRTGLPSLHRLENKED